MDNALMSPEQFASLKMIALMIFLAAFVVILGWLVFTRSSKFAEVARMPLNDDAPANRGTTHE